MEQPENVNFELITRGLKSDIFYLDQVQNPFHISVIQAEQPDVDCDEVAWEVEKVITFIITIITTIIMIIITRC